MRLTFGAQGRAERKQVLVLGSGRSGTSWLAEILASNGSYRYVFEPLHRQHTLRDCPFYDIMPVPSVSQDAEFKAFFARILAGRIHNGWVDSQSHIRRSTRILVKEIRANLALGWIARSFPEVRILLLVRSPLAVMASRMATADWAWGDLFHRTLRHVLSLGILSDREIRSVTSEDNGPREHMLLAWCLENLIALRITGEVPGNVRLVFFEDLVLDPRASLQGICDFVGDPLRSVTEEGLAEPSNLSVRPPRLQREEYLTDWQNNPHGRSNERISEIMDAFQLGFFYPDSVLPNRKAFLELASGSGIARGIDSVTGVQDGKLLASVENLSAPLWKGPR